MMLTWYAAAFPGGGGKLHAARRVACAFGQQFDDDEMRARWEAEADANDPGYLGTFTIRMLCQRGGCSSAPRVGRDRFSPAGLYEFAGGRTELATCGDCAALFSALHTEPVPGMDRKCRLCSKTLPVNYFRTDRRRGDQVASACTPCWFEARRDRQWERTYGRPRPARRIAPLDQFGPVKP